MDKLLEHYIVDIELPNVGGVEYLEMLQLRDKLFEKESILSASEKEALLTADRRLIERANEFYAELSRFVDFEQRRQAQQIPTTRWWWYLDVLVELPLEFPSEKQELVT